MKPVRKAVFPLAGHGTRFLPMTKSSPKGMLPIVDKPVVQCVLEEAVAAGINQVEMVTGRDKRAIEDPFDISHELEEVFLKKDRSEALEELCRITTLSEIIYLRQKEALGLGPAILCTKNVKGDEPLIVALGDKVMDDPETANAQLSRSYEKIGVGPVIEVQRLPICEVQQYGIIARAELSTGLYWLDRLIERPPSDLVIIGRYLLIPDSFSVLEHQPLEKGGEIPLTDDLNTLGQNPHLYAMEIVCDRFDTGERLGFLKATLRFFLKSPDSAPSFQDFLMELVHNFPTLSTNGESIVNSEKCDYVNR